MKTEILKITDKLTKDEITSDEAQKLLLSLFGVSSSEKSWLEEELDEANSISDDVEKLEKYNDIASDIANQFTYDMSKLEDAIQVALDEVSNEAKQEIGYWSVCDVTQDIDVTKSWEW